ncbi:YisB protein [Plectosphaerella cucumerina]|uniref:YisB protein n=1 Tax=Plectosphaerella cucumerina TaxID=40658 RepID=A0A8K0TGS8_9PEZI|nr:YisB protein [Plectosphaerella cucumerina]
MSNTSLDTPQFDIFRDCLSAAIVERVTRPAAKAKKRARKGKHDQVDAAPVSADTGTANDAEDLAEFIDYIAGETFESLPDELKTLTHIAWAAPGDIQTRYALPLTGSDAAAILHSLDPSIPESLITYGIIDGERQGAPELLAPVLNDFIGAATAPPPPPRATKGAAEGCELCGRDWIPLTYHHLIPRFVHEKAVRRGWHRPEDLENVAWLCRLCHSSVHRFASHEDLARHYYTVELLLAEDEVVKFARYASKVRWKGR